MREYLFDVKLFAALRVKAKSVSEARELLAETLDAATITVEVDHGGEPLIGEASVDGDPDLVEEYDPDGASA